MWKKMPTTVPEITRVPFKIVYWQVFKFILHNNHSFIQKESTTCKPSHLIFFLRCLQNVLLYPVTPHTHQAKASDFPSHSFSTFHIFPLFKITLTLAHNLEQTTGWQVLRSQSYSGISFSLVYRKTKELIIQGEGTGTKTTDSCLDQNRKIWTQRYMYTTQHKQEIQGYVQTTRTRLLNKNYKITQLSWVVTKTYFNMEIYHVLL